jgi:tetratricopeptide (TPR) repeat protein
MCLATLVFLSLLAQEAPANAGRRAKSAAQVMLKQGTSLYGRGEYADALEAFQKAYALYPSPKLLFNIGRANNELRRPVEAIHAFESFLAQDPNAPAGMLTEATRTTAELSSKLARLSIECPVVGADVALDGKSLGHAPIAEEIWVVPGRHQVTATSEGAAPIVKKVTLAAAMAEIVVLQPVDSGKPSPPSPPDVEAEAHRSQEPHGDRGLWLGRTWTWVAAGTAVAAAGGAIVAGTMMKSKFNELDKKCGASSGQDFSGCGASDIRALDARKNTANVLWGVSVAALVTAGILYYFEGRPVAFAPMAGEHMGLVASVRY